MIRPMSIRLLPPDVAGKIAAGEVVERQKSTWLAASPATTACASQHSSAPAAARSLHNRWCTRVGVIVQSRRADLDPWTTLC